MRCILLLLLILPLRGSTQQFIAQHYSQTNGLPQNSVNALFWDKQNLLWIATDDGLVRFDGNTFCVFKDDTPSNLYSHRFRWFAPLTAKNSMLVTSAAGRAYQLKGITVEPYPGIRTYRNILTDRLSAAEINWLLARETTAELRKRSWFDYPVTAIHTDDRLWIMGRKSIYVYRNQVLTDSVVIPKGTNPKTMFRLGHDIWIVCSDRLLLLNHHTKAIRENKDSTGREGYHWFRQAGSDHVLLLKDDHVYELSAKNDSVVQSRLICTFAPGQIRSSVSCLFYNRELNTLAVGTSSRGLYLMRPALFNYHTGGTNTDYYAQEKLNDSAMIGSNGYEFTAHTSTENSGYYVTGINNKNIKLDRRGRLWSLKNDSILCQEKWKKRHSVYINNRNGIADLMCNGDTVYALTGSVLLKFYGNRYDSVSLSKQFQDRPTVLRAVIFENKLVAATPDGLFLIDPGNGGVKKISDIKNVLSLTVWKGCITGSAINTGIFVLYKGKTVTLPQDPHENLKRAHQLYESPGGNVYISTNRGLVLTKNKWIADYLDAKCSYIPWKYYSANDGLENVEFNGGCSPGLVTLNNGIVSFPNMGGFVWFKPEQIERMKEVPPRLYFSRVLVDNIAQQCADTIIVPANAENISIQPGCIYWNNPLDIKIEYQLKGIMSEPRLFNKMGELIQFTTLPAGTYQLILHGEAGLAGYGDTIVLTLIKEPKFYESTWFFLLLILFAIVVMICGNIIYNKALLQRNYVLETKVKERTSELQRANAELLGSQNELLQSIHVKSKLISIIAHDIITPLKFISRVTKGFNSSGLSDKDAQEEVMNEIYHTSHRLYDNAQNVLNWIRYQNHMIVVKTTPVAPFVIGDEIADLFTDLAAVRNNTISNHIDMEDMIETDKTILSIILHNLVSNAVKYNKNTSVELHSQQTANEYIISVKDNGRGMSPESLEHIHSLRKSVSENAFNSHSEGTGLGYIIIFELASLINARIAIESGPGLGAVISVHLYNK